MPTAYFRRFALLFSCLLSVVIPKGSIAQQSPFFAPGNLVVVVEGCGVQGGTCTSVPNGQGNGTGNSSSGGYGDNQAAPVTLFQFKPNGSSSATYVNSLVLPQTASGANLPLSGEYGSSSEGSIQLSGNGAYLTFMGYGLPAATFNASPATYGALPSNAFAQSGSLTGQSYTAVPRVITLVDANGNVNTSTPIYNVFNTNNPRSIWTADGTTAWISGQGTGSGTDATGGVFYTPIGAVNNAPVAITGLDTSSNTLSQDTRNLQVYNNTLYVSVDTKGGSNNARSYIGTLGTPPATSLYSSNAGPTQVPFSSNANTTVLSSTSKLTLTASETNGINSTGQQINLSPSGFFFANAYTLYIADTGNPKQNAASNLLGDGGLQKWVNTRTDGTGTWQLQYTMATGLNLVANPSAVPANTTGATGLYSLAGVVSGNTVYLYAVNYNISDLDHTYLYGITDTLSATTNPGNTFTQLAIAPSDSNFKGVSFTPTYPAGSATITTVPSGLTVTTAGTGCVPGTYVTPMTLVWTPGSTCTLSTTSVQTTGSTHYVFTQWQDNTTATSDMVIAPSTATTYTANFSSTYKPVGVLERVVDNATAGTPIKSGDSLLVSGWVADPVDGAPLSNVKVYVDGNVFGTPTLGLARADVAATYNNTAYTNSGYQLIASTAGLTLGTHAVTVVAVDAAGNSATFGPTNFNLVGTPAITVGSSSIVAGTATTTLTASVAYTGAAPAGSLTFTVNGSTTGVGTVSCTGSTSPVTCTASYASASLTPGSYPIVATETASNTSLAVSGTGTLTVTAATDFSFANSGTTSQTVTRGSATSFAFALKPVSTSYPSTVTFSVTGLPAGASYMFTPTSVAATGTAQTVTLSVQTPANVSANSMPSSRWPRTAITLAGLCVLPLLFRRRLRSGVSRTVALLLFLCGSLIGIAGLTGCSNGLTQSTAIPVSYSLTVTATSGSVQHTAAVTLTLQ